ncbi:hypothetical protein CU097_004063, partial [Rhizopus azygosporus]
MIGNVTVHKTPETLQTIHGCGHSPLFLFLSPIEAYWAKINQEMRKTPLMKNEILADRKEEEAKTAENRR